MLVNHLLKTKKEFKSFKDLQKRTATDKVLRDKAFNIAKILKYDGYQRSLASMVYKFFDKKTSGGAIKFMQNQKLANELHKPIIRKLKKRRVYSSFKDNIWGADLLDMQLIIIFNKGIKFLLCVIDIYSKYLWVVPLTSCLPMLLQNNKLIFSIETQCCLKYEISVCVCGFGVWLFL